MLDIAVNSSILCYKLFFFFLNRLSKQLCFPRLFKLRTALTYLLKEKKDSRLNYFIHGTRFFVNMYIYTVDWTNNARHGNILILREPNYRKMIQNSRLCILINLSYATKHIRKFFLVSFLIIRNHKTRTIYHKHFFKTTK